MKGRNKQPRMVLKTLTGAMCNKYTLDHMVKSMLPIRKDPQLLYFLQQLGIFSLCIFCTN
jgi:hypothetical protein